MQVRLLRHDVTMRRDSRPPAITDLELLLVEIGVIRGTDDPQPLHDTAEVVVAMAADGTRGVVAGDRVPQAMVDRLTHGVASAMAAVTAEGVPSAVAACADLLAATEGHSRDVSGGPSYLVERPAPVPGPQPICSDDPRAADVLGLRPPTWEPVEWAELVAGGDGAPWAMLCRDGRVVSICHSARLTRAGAEAGTWTAEDYRGRGYAAAVTAAWAPRVAALCPRVFYSTSSDNRSSQRVAERLGLRRLGSLWTLRRPREDG